MEGFALSLTDPIEILRDHDTITYGSCHAFL
jgi:hypothetical protein